MIIKEDDLTHPAVHRLLDFHLNGMVEQSPKASNYALDLSGLQKDAVTVWTVWGDHALLGIGAIHELSPTWAEIKSMRTHPDHIRKGVAARLLDHIFTISRERGYEKLSLETGTTAAFKPAIIFYKKYGFESGVAFAEYKESPYNQFMHLNLA